MKNKEDLIKAFSSFLDDHFGDVIKTAPVYKASILQEELREATFVVLSPDEYDLHNHIYSESEVKDAHHSYKSCMKANLHHLLMVGEDVVTIIDSSITPEDSYFGETFVKKGTWIQTWKIHNDEVWKGVKDGFYTGLSIQCIAEVEYIE